MHGQVRELCTNYGKLDLMWFDFSYDDMTGEKWRGAELVRMVRSLQPDIILDNRLEVSGSGFGSIATDEPLEFSGDYVSPEQIIPQTGFKDSRGRDILLGGLHHDERQLGLLREGQELQARRDDHQKARRVCEQKRATCF